MTPDEIGQFLEEFDYEYFLNLALEQVPEGLDTREGSIIYDALAPASYTLAEFTMTLKNVMLETFVQTATGGYLDLRAEEHGLSRISATPAVATAIFKSEPNTTLQLNIGDRFSTIGDDPIYFKVSAMISDEIYTLTCETTGIAGNEYVGELLPIDHINNLESAVLTEITIPARDVESDDDLRDRVLKTYQLNDFGGNIEDYINYVIDMDGIGAVQIYPVWNGGGTVRVVILNNDFGLPSTTLIDNVQTALDPTGNQTGIGIAPIGHKVAVVAPTTKTVDVSLHIDVLVNYSLEKIKPKILEALETHFKEVRSAWSSHNDLYKYGQTVYRSQIISSLLKVDGVANVANVELNGTDDDIDLRFTNAIQEVAFLGDVIYT